MELRQIHMFVLLAEQLSFSKVAKIYHISQSAISKQLSLLEYDLGGKLFERDTRRVQLSELGYLFLPYAKKIVNLEEEALVVANAFNQNAPHEIYNLYIDSSLISDSVAFQFPQKLLRATQRFNQQFPNLRIQTHIFPEREWRALLKFQLFDIAVVQLPGKKFEDPVMNVIDLSIICRIQQYLVLHDPGKTYETVSDAIRSVDVLLQDQSVVLKDLMGLFLSKVPPNAHLTDCDNWNDLFLRLMSERAATIVPENALSYFDGMDVSVFPLENMDMDNYLCAYCPIESAKTATPHLLEMLKQEFATPN